MEATEVYEPACFAVMSYGIETDPPAVGPVVCTWYCEPSAGADAMFAPLEPVRFSAPQLTPESASPVPALPASVPVPYVHETSSLEGPGPAAPLATRSQTSNECVVALPKFLMCCQSTTIHVDEPSVSVPIRTAPPGEAVGFRSLQSGASVLFGRAAFGKCCGVNTMSLLVPPPTTR